MDSLPPPYSTTEPSTAAPAYSDLPRESDLILPSDPQAFVEGPRCTNFNWKFKTSHMLIDFGPRIWGLHHPSYGLDGIIRFSVQSNGAEFKDQDLTATLEGYLYSSTTQTVVFMSEPIQMVSSPRRDPLQKNTRKFSIKVPSTITIQGAEVPTPPSFWLCDFASAGCDIKYRVKVRLGGLQGLRVKHEETKIIPIFYLPKSRPAAAPLTTLTRPMQATDGSIVCPGFLNSNRTKTFAMSPKFSRSSCPRSDLSEFQSSIFVTLPSTLCFTSGQRIPYLFSCVFPSRPHLSKLYANSGSSHVMIVKRLSLFPHRRRRIGWILVDVPGEVQEWQLASSSPKYLSEYNEGVCMVRGFVGTGEAGGERSWKLAEHAKLEYILRATVNPPSHLSDTLPSFEHEEIVELTTDQWDTLQRELSSLGGVPTPALRLSKNQCPEPYNSDYRTWIL